MKMNFGPVLLLLAAAVSFAAPPEAIQRATLDERVVVTVPVSTNRVSTISFPGPIAASEVVQLAPQVTPPRLLALLDMAKAFPLLRKQQPDGVAGAEARTFGDEPQVTDFNDYEIRIKEVFRFNVEDTGRVCACTAP